ncbi:MAG: AAA family ATPase [Bacteroidota bacterium]
MQIPKRLYVAATSQHVGKTTSTLGLIAALRQQGNRVGYCKPAGQKYVWAQGEKVDKDAQLFADYLGFELEPDLHSPVILEPGLIKDHIEEPQRDALIQPILSAANRLSAMHDVVVFEGTGHPGVGSTVGISNAQVAKALDAGVILILEGGIGSTLDMLALNRAIFQQEGVPIVGVILNKTRKDKMAKVAHYVETYLQRLNIPLLGLLPYEASLSLPQLGSVTAAIDGRMLLFPEETDRPVQRPVSGRQFAKHFGKTEHLLLVSSARRLEESLAEVDKLSNGQPDLAGIVLCGEATLTQQSKRWILRHRIPLVFSPWDSYEVVNAFSRLEVKINCRTPWKSQKAIELFQAHIFPERMYQYVG